MEKYIYNEQNGLWYELQGDYYIPCLVLDIDSYLASFEQLYADGQLDRLKPSTNQQQNTELLDFSTWDTPYFEDQDTPDRLAGDLAILMNRYDPYGAQQYAEIIDRICL